MQKEMKLKMGEKETSLQSVSAEADVAEALNSEAFAPVLLLQSRIWLASGEPLEVVNSLMKSYSSTHKIQVQRVGTGVPDYAPPAGIHSGC